MTDAAPARGATGAASTSTAAGRVLCRLDDIEDGQAKGFALDEGPGGREIFVVREEGRVFGYLNACPHLGSPLNWQDDRFISDDSGLILCATHGARFEIEDGACVSGPCAGQTLEAVPVTVDAEGRVVLIGD